MNKAIFQILLLMPMILVLDYPALANQSQITEASASADYDYSQYDPKITLSEDYQNYKTLLKSNPTDKSKTDVYLVNQQTKKESFFITVSNIRDYYFHEYKNGNIYLIKRIGDYHISDDWTDELWKYNYQKKGHKLISLKGLSFSVAPNEEYVAVSNYGKLQILNGTTGDNQTFLLKDFLSKEDIRQFAAAGIFPKGWSDDSKICWIVIRAGMEQYYYIQIFIDSWNISKYNVLALSLEEEDALNYNTGKITYSDFPVFYESASYEQYKKTNSEVHLYVYDLNTQKNVLIDTSIAKKFDPKWIDDNTIEYNNPNGEGRIKYVVK